jgi:hypothetical protein
MNDQARAAAERIFAAAAALAVRRHQRGPFPRERQASAAAEVRTTPPGAIPVTRAAQNCRWSPVTWKTGGAPAAAPAHPRGAPVPAAPRAAA